MNNTKRRFAIRATVAVFLLSISIVAAGLGRGFYDRMFMLEGQVVVVNASNDERAIRIAFPAGEKMEVTLKAGGSSRFVVGKTGEGSVAVSVDGVRKDEVGYVTSRNGMIMITVADDRVVFSQIPALQLEGTNPKTFKP